MAPLSLISIDSALVGAWQRLTFFAAGALFLPSPIHERSETCVVS